MQQHSGENETQPMLTATEKHFPRHKDHGGVMHYTCRIHRDISLFPPDDKCKIFVFFFSSSFRPPPRSKEMKLNYWSKKRGGEIFYPAPFAKGIS